MASDGELDPDYLLRVAWAAGKSCYLPCIRKRFGQPRENYLWFGRTQPNSVLRTNKYGIPEPDLRIETVISAKALDLVLMPLVAFDEQGNRLGMGKGYFDQTFAFIRHGPTWHRPKLMGLAHECQKSNSLISNDWDVPLDAIATDCQIYLSSNHIPQEI
jgi:5-formyltetrahydrofolate cyclo-ligase